MTTPPLTLHRDDGPREARPVVLLHGFPDTAASWDTVADALVADGHRVVVPHLRGYTRDSIVPGRPYGARELAEDVLATLDAIGHDAPVVAGHDWGASMAFGAASLAPERIAGLVGVAIPHPRTVKPTPRLAIAARHFLTLKLPWAAAQFRLRDFRAVEVLYRRWAPAWRGPDRDACIADFVAAVRDPAVLDGTLAYYKALSPTPPREVNRRLATPTLVVGGTTDLLPPAAFEASTSAFTGPVEVAILEGAGHWPHRERQEAFLGHMRGFLAGLG